MTRIAKRTRPAALLLGAALVVLPVGCDTKPSEAEVRETNKAATASSPATQTPEYKKAVEESEERARQATERLQEQARKNDQVTATATAAAEVEVKTPSSD